jgi:hypothetical protein
MSTYMDFGQILYTPGPCGVFFAAGYRWSYGLTAPAARAIVRAHTFLQFDSPRFGGAFLYCWHRPGLIQFSISTQRPGAGIGAISAGRHRSSSYPALLDTVQS